MFKGKIKGVLIVLCALIILVLSVFAYFNYRLSAVEKDVKNYLIEDKKVKEKDIVELESSFANLAGDKKYLVYVKLKNDEKKYYYYKDTKEDKVLLESYILKGKEHVVN